MNNDLLPQQPLTKGCMCNQSILYTTKGPSTRVLLFIHPSKIPYSELKSFLANHLDFVRTKKPLLAKNYFPISFGLLLCKCFCAFFFIKYLKNLIPISNKQNLINLCLLRVSIDRSLEYSCLSNCGYHRHYLQVSLLFYFKHVCCGKRFVLPLEHVEAMCVLGKQGNSIPC